MSCVQNNPQNSVPLGIVPRAEGMKIVHTVHSGDYGEFL